VSDKQVMHQSLHLSGDGVLQPQQSFCYVGHVGASCSPQPHWCCRARGRRVLPCVIDVGTDNEALQNLDLYMGLHQPRITDQDLYRDIMDEVGAASAFKGFLGASGARAAAATPCNIDM